MTSKKPLAGASKSRTKALLALALGGVLLYLVLGGSSDDSSDNSPATGTTSADLRRSTSAAGAAANRTSVSSGGSAGEPCAAAAAARAPSAPGSVPPLPPPPPPAQQTLPRLELETLLAADPFASALPGGDPQHVPPALPSGDPRNGDASAVPLAADSASRVSLVYIQEGKATALVDGKETPIDNPNGWAEVIRTRLIEGVLQRP